MKTINKVVTTLVKKHKKEDDIITCLQQKDLPQAFSNAFLPFLRAILSLIFR